MSWPITNIAHVKTSRWHDCKVSVLSWQSQRRCSGGCLNSSRVSIVGAFYCSYIAMTLVSVANKKIRKKIKSRKLDSTRFPFPIFNDPTGKTFGYFNDDSTETTKKKKEKKKKQKFLYSFKQIDQGLERRQILKQYDSKNKQPCKNLLGKSVHDLHYHIHH